MPSLFGQRLHLIALVIASSVVFAVSFAEAVETVSFRESKSGKPRTVVGEILVEAQDGGLLLRGDDGRIWLIQPEEMVDRKSDDSELVPITADQMERRMMEEMPKGFAVYRTANYLIVYNANEEYAKTVGALFEQLHKTFFAYWKNQRWELAKPRFPLVALVLANKNEFLKHGIAEVGESARSVIGYYDRASNRMTTFNIPNLERNIATIIHEGTHQLAFNCGMQTRYADNPQWVSEGLATFFESPNISSKRGWTGVGRVNQVNLARWRRYQRSRPADSLATLLADNSRFQNPASVESAYGEAWALTYFLIKTRRKEYTAFMQKLSQGKPLAEKSPRERIEIFESSFGMTLAKADKAFVTYMRRVR